VEEAVIVSSVVKGDIWLEIAPTHQKVCPLILTIFGL